MSWFGRIARLGVASILLTAACIYGVWIGKKDAAATHAVEPGQASQAAAPKQDDVETQKVPSAEEAAAALDGPSMPDEDDAANAANAANGTMDDDGLADELAGDPDSDLPPPGAEQPLAALAELERIRAIPGAAPLLDDILAYMRTVDPDDVSVANLPVDEHGFAHADDHLSEQMIRDPEIRAKWDKLMALITAASAAESAGPRRQ
jgi:hypothetical protein